MANEIYSVGDILLIEVPNHQRRLEYVDDKIMWCTLYVVELVSVITNPTNDAGKMLGTDKGRYNSR